MGDIKMNWQWTVVTLTSACTCAVSLQNTKYQIPVGKMKIKVKEVRRSGKKGNPKGKTINTSKLGTQKDLFQRNAYA